jgi:hypothetical protein
MTGAALKAVIPMIMSGLRAVIIAVDIGIKPA